jgi:4-oxalocrotonate tautomerase family enzyme
MPHVNISIIGPSPTAEQKSTLFSEITDLMVEVLGRTRRLVMVSVTSAPTSDWAVGGASPNDAGLVGLQAVIHIPAGTASDEQKARMISESTRVLRTVIGTPIFPLYVLFQETSPADWGYDGRTLAAIRAAKAA